MFAGKTWEEICVLCQYIPRDYQQSWYDGLMMSADSGLDRGLVGAPYQVGKTYAMLKAAHERKKEGVDVWIGFVETHNRAETLKLIDNLPIIPRKKIEYKGTLQEEMDLSEILLKKPQLVLIDELAHTNVPGTRHEKRYQDVIEILDAGIDVYSTMNVQHLESRADVVGLITATTIRETVPDSILDYADQIELIDITPYELISRLKEGKIYPGRKTEQALQYFFQEGNLNALREIALRATADKVERDMRGKSLSNEKLLVAIGPSPFSEKLIRTARRVVEDLEMPWVAVHVDTGVVLNIKDNNQLVRNLDLAVELGAEVVTLHGRDIATAISSYVKENKVRQIILGRPQGRIKWWSKSSRFIENIIKENPEVDITILQKPPETTKKIQANKFSLAFQATPFLKTLFWVLTTSVLNFFLNSYIGYRAVGFIFLILVVYLSLFFPFSSVIGAAAFSALIWNYFFIPPRGTFAINTPEDFMMFIMYFIVASVCGFLAFQAKRDQKILKDREEKTQALYDILKSMTLVQGTKPLIDMALVKIENLFNAECAILLAHEGKMSPQPDFGKMILTENDYAVATLSFDHGRKAGWSTDTLPLSKVFCLALKSGENRFGVLVFKSKTDKKLSPEQANLLISIANQIGIVLAKQKYDEEHRQADWLKESAKLHQTLLNCISHELRTPLTSIMGAATAMQVHYKGLAQPPPTGQAGLEPPPQRTFGAVYPEGNISILIDEIINSSERLNHIFENLLDVTRLESGAVKLKKEWFDLSELVFYTVERQKRMLAQHTVDILSAKTPLYFFGDFELFSHALSNLLLNAVHYSPPGGKIIISSDKQADFLVIAVQDQGPGIPKELVSSLFEKFYRLPGTPTGGLGLGLSIAKNFVELHHGHIEVRNNADGGATFVIFLPYSVPPGKILET